jgi:hypothetical protein
MINQLLRSKEYNSRSRCFVTLQFHFKAVSRCYGIWLAILVRDLHWSIRVSHGLKVLTITGDEWCCPSVQKLLAWVPKVRHIELQTGTSGWLK